MGWVEVGAFIIGVVLAFSVGIVAGYIKGQREVTAAMRWVESFGINPIGRLVVAKYERSVFDDLTIGDQYVVALALEELHKGDVVAIWERVGVIDIPEIRVGKSATGP